MGYEACRDSCEYIIKYSGNIKTLEKDDRINLEILSEKFAIVNLYEETIKVLKNNKNIIYIEPASRTIKLKNSNNYRNSIFLYKRRANKRISMLDNLANKNIVELLNLSIADIEDEVLRDTEFIFYNLNKKYSEAIITTTELIREIKYLLNEGKKNDQPMLIITGIDILNTLEMGHSLFWECIESLIYLDRRVMVISGKEENEKLLHCNGKLQNNHENKVVFNVDSKEKAIILELHINKYDNIGLELVCPDGEAIGKLNNRKSFYKFEGKEMECYICYKDIDKASELLHMYIIVISKKENLECGKWKIFLDGEDIVDGQYYLSLLQDEFIPQNIKFIKRKVVNKNLPKFSSASNIISVDSINSLIVNNKDFSQLSTLQVSALVAFIMEKGIKYEKIKKYLYKILKSYGRRGIKHINYFTKSSFKAPKLPTTIEPKHLNNAVEYRGDIKKALEIH